MRQISRAGILWGARPFSCAPVLVPQGDAKLVLRLFEVEDPGAVFKGQLEPEEGREQLERERAEAERAERERAQGGQAEE